uniref:Uncharacterized protein n=1 Tax=Cannabis sativa TaxID=3483 RepID=A0A803Q695_CANSA
MLRVVAVLLGSDGISDSSKGYFVALIEIPVILSTYCRNGNWDRVIVMLRINHRDTIFSNKYGIGVICVWGSGGCNNYVIGMGLVCVLVSEVLVGATGIGQHGHFVHLLLDKDAESGYLGQLRIEQNVCIQLPDQFERFRLVNQFIFLQES